jgi:Tfp pilus assembly protein FimT
MRNSKTGLTKVELLVCLCICATLGAAGSSAWYGILPDLQLGSAVRDVYTVMQAARIYSIKERTEVAVSPVQGPGLEAFVDNGAAADAGNGRRDAGEALICRRVFPPAVELVKITFSDGRLRFNSRGMPRGAGSVYLRNRKGKHLGISVAISGALSMKESKDGGSTWKRL